MSKGKIKNKLILAYRNLAYQNGEKEKRAAELYIANQELVFQNEEKEKCAIELVIANKELAYQNEEKEKRATELRIANDELSFQNEEKKKREEELVIANKELLYQNDEKEKQAAKLSIANQELVLQNIEKEKSTAELRISNQELKNAEEDLVRSRLQLRNFAHHLNHIQEEDRAHLARELHDELGQQLAGIKMGLSLITMFSSKEKMAEKAGDMLKDVDSAIQAMRKIATELRPGILDSLGLAPSLEWLGMEFAKKNKIKCTVKINVKESRFEKDISNCFFRVCQESLTNISKHAEACEVTIAVIQSKDELTMKISDNGKGIASEKLENPFSMGLLGMRERASIIGAGLTVTSKIDSGTIVKLHANIKKLVRI